MRIVVVGPSGEGFRQDVQELRSHLFMWPGVLECQDSVFKVLGWDPITVTDARLKHPQTGCGKQGEFRDVLRFGGQMGSLTCRSVTCGQHTACIPCLGFSLVPV